MKSKSLDFRQIEWWVVTAAFLSIILFNLFLFSPGFHETSGFEIFRFVARLAIPLTLYVSFHLVHMVLIPKYEREKKPALPIIFSILIAAASLLICAILAYNTELTHAPFPTFYLGVVGIYVCYLIGAFILEQALTPPKIRDFQIYNIIRLVFIYLFTILFLIQLLDITNPGPLVVFGMVVPGLLFLGLYHYYFIYKNIETGKIKRSRWFTYGLAAMILFVFMVISVESNHSEEIFFLGGIPSVAFLLVILFPLATLIFRKYDSYIGNLGKITTLTYQVDHGNASMDFLRSQINPHFLFNALNTLYASALMENAEKTSDGIQKLGDMMRFMLHENQLPQIPLSREINYLRNYLDLQMLRFGAQNNLEIDIQINESNCAGDIAPMLLIPFVENAFKHGISAKEKSWIRLNLRCISGSVHLDLVNSTHPEKPASEKSQEESGIGLENVQHRLQLMYPDRHQLNIFSNDTDFFVHLSIQLKN
ncbi:sensor histidine kinase [Algoriphagus sp. A40]|uniref:sensor histidine kinase n=1 Tax=Algoriphagus sp. A40 TaxID=1945863 RepID=UPI000985F6C3|nr:histidine kinase [Algoriphagus sp. A40]OOG73661.1 histidine kinase [Algoriphagus sp. A40]